MKTPERIRQYTEVNMNIAKEYAKLSYAKRNKVGSVLVTPDNTRVLCPGYNGTPTGFDNSCEWFDETGEYLAKGQLVTKPEVVHAEANVILFAARYGLSTENCILYVTLSPCVECAKMIIQAGIKKVVYLDDYRDTSGLELLKRAGIEIERYDNGDN